jgi:signal transduction histidine kinase
MSSQSTTIVHFLIVDDLAENLVALEALLRRPGLSVLKARSGAEALELLLAHDVALAIVDVQMPGMNGFELAELMRGTERTRRIPIIFVTAGVADRQRRFEGYEAGAVDFLGKPIEPDVLRGKADVFYELYLQRLEVAQQRDELKNAASRIERLLEESQRQAAALREADQRKDEFLAMLAHELRNPLAPIHSAIEILRLAASQNEQLQGPIEIAARQVRHMSRLIDDLLDVARIVKGKIELRIEPCDLVAIAKNTAEDYRAILRGSGIELEIAASVESLPTQGDATRIAQIMGNLLHNAGKFTPPGGKIAIEILTEDASTAAISVVDSGVGFELTDPSCLFDPFCQAGQTTESRSGGLGLGLALAKGLTELHGGRINAKSEGLGRGAVFTVRLPIVKNLHQVDATRESK